MSTIEKTFEDFTQRKDIAILLINQHVLLPIKSCRVNDKIADKIRYRVDNYTAAFPTILEIPSKEHPYGKRILSY
jgi:V-type H+-transporting ATPase subunit F